MLLEINPLNPDTRLITSVVEKMKQGAVIIYPTDSVYAMGCDPESKKGVEKLFQIKNSDPNKRQLTFMCSNISMASTYANQISNSNYRFIKEHTPGPYTFILPATNNLPKILNVKNKTFGFRIPDHKIPTELINALGRPILSSSLKTVDEDSENRFYMYPEDIYSDYSLMVDMIIDGGPGSLEHSTVIDLTEGEPIVIREGKGNVDTE
ncbi:MAG: threonylcarbamoyl-AMP synthase [Saprospiraceae bacterium]|jgi:tRNA threonylcarbamoyl adenosine modification protein (Sua5/YciO/YrdC/YwlC family)|nr:threonylcarbamoyl-AMP synthase [Saprospiraceae bacterium]